MTNQKTCLHNLSPKCIPNKKRKYDIYKSIQTLYSVLCWSRFGRDYSIESSWVQRFKLGTPVFGEFLPFFSTYYRYISLVTIASPTCSTRSCRYISPGTPKTNSFFGRLSFQFSAVNDWNERQKSLKLETLISLTSFKHQLSEQLTDYCTCT